MSDRDNLHVSQSSSPPSDFLLSLNSGSLTCWNPQWLVYVTWMWTVLSTYFCVLFVWRCPSWPGLDMLVPMRTAVCHVADSFNVTLHKAIFIEPVICNKETWPQLHETQTGALIVCQDHQYLTLIMLTWLNGSQSQQPGSAIFWKAERRQYTMSWMLELQAQPEHMVEIFRYLNFCSFTVCQYLKKWLKLEHDFFKGKFQESVGGFYIV